MIINSKQRELYSDKEGGYYSSARNNITELIPIGNHKILDVGCGIGALLSNLKQTGKAAEAVGIEVNNLDFSKDIDRVIVGDIEQLQLPYPAGYFDVIICADVLEHVRDPWATLAWLTGHLKDGGLFVISLPNIREIRTLLEIIVRGDFAYTERGILDRTHLRFFCRRNMVDMVQSAGLAVDRIHPLMGARRNAINKISLKAFEEFLAIQYLITAGKPERTR